MTDRKIEETRRISAQTESGEAAEIIEYTTFIRPRELSGNPGWTPTTSAYRLSNGRDLNPRDHGTFEVVQTGEILRPLQ